jgi:hypothetical protein
MYVGSVGIFISGEREFLAAQWAIDSSKTLTAETCLLNLKNCTTYNTVSNTGLIRLRSLSASYGNTTSSYAIIRMKKAVTIGGSPSYTTINGTSADGGTTITSGNSITSYDVAGTTVTGGLYIFQCVLTNNTNQIIDLTPYNIYIAPSEIMTISGFASNSGVVTVGINWNEDV